MTVRHDTHLPSIVLATLNAKYIHASLGLRYLLANMGGLRAQTTLCEFTIARPAHEIVAELVLALEQPTSTQPSVQGVRIVGFGVYIWNVLQTTEVVRQLKANRPDIRIVLGGPEVSHELDTQEIVALADHVITGWGDLSFAALCRSLLDGGAPPEKVIVGEQPPLARIALPYAEYSDTDLARRVVYVEASRGCPFKCEFCLSALDKTAWSFDLDRILGALQSLYARGARNFKFVDRTFNLGIETSTRLLQFFLDRLAPCAASAECAAAGDLFVHFEVIPDHLPDRLKAVIAQFPPGVLQFEVGVQSFNDEVQQRISRRQDNAKTEANLRWLVGESNAHVHADLIFGLPGETLASFAAGFNRLSALQPHEIQLGLLKRLRGTPITRHSAAHGMVYDPASPYTVRQTGVVDAATVTRFSRFARYWDLIANSGRFARTMPLLLTAHAQSAAENASSPFHAFLGFSDWLWDDCGKTSGLSPETLVDALFEYLHGVAGMPEQTVRAALLSDYVASGARGSPQALRGLLPKRAPPTNAERSLALRQARHLGGGQTADRT